MLNVILEIIHGHLIKCLSIQFVEKRRCISQKKKKNLLDTKHIGNCRSVGFWSNCMHCEPSTGQNERNGEAVLLTSPIGVNKIPLVRCDTSIIDTISNRTSTKLVTKSNKKKHQHISTEWLDCTNKMWYMWIKKMGKQAHKIMLKRENAEMWVGEAWWRECGENSWVCVWWYWWWVRERESF